MGVAEASNHRTVRLSSMSIDTLQPATYESDPASDIRLVQFDRPLTRSEQVHLESSVERIFTYLPDFTYLVRTCSDPNCGLTSGSPNLQSAELGAVWTGPYLARYKLSPEITDASSESDRVHSVLLHLFPDIDLDRAVDAIETITGDSAVGSTANDRFSRVRILLTESQIAQHRSLLSELAGVFWIEREARRTLLNDTTIWVGQSSLNGGASTPIFDNGLFGEGEIVAVLDTGIDADSCYFRDSVEGLPPTNCLGATTINPNHRKILGVDFLWDSDCNGGISATEWDNQGHGTHVAGTVAGDDPNPAGGHNLLDGMAPAAKLIIQDGGFGTDDCADLPGLGCSVIDLTPIFQQTYDQGARIHTNSWGDEENDPTYGEYTAASQDVDQFMWDHPDFLLLFAAGNNGGASHTVDSPSTAKSSISVGSTLRAQAAGSLSGFSSKGPTLDGRIKPELTVPGSNILSASNNGSVTSPSCEVVSNSGTSMATPGAAGFAALVREYFVKGFYPSGSAVPGDAMNPSAALVKAALVNSSTQMASEGEIPNDRQGWGRVFLDSTLHFAGESRKLWIEDDKVGFLNGASGTSLTYDLVVESSDEPFEVTLNWTDFPSVPAAGTHLVNDLDLVLTGPSGTFRGNVFSGGFSASGGSADRLNTLENIALQSPVPGTYTVTVEAFNIPSGTSQPFAVVASGRVSPCSAAGSAKAVPGTGQLILQTGDGDSFLDNCEAARLEFSILNQNIAAATNVRIVGVSSPSHPDTVFSNPTWSSASVPSCSLDETPFIDIVSASSLQPGGTLQIQVEVTTDEAAPETAVTLFEVATTEQDLVTVANLTYEFESDLEGWTVASGEFGRDSVLGGAGGSSFYLQSSANLGDQCDLVVSPEIHLTPTSTLSLETHYEIESGPPWYDRANLSILDSGAPAAVVEPSSGRPYDVEDNSPNGPCGTVNEAGWSGDQSSWGLSQFDSQALDAVNHAGSAIQFQVEYATDGGLHLGGFRFDRFSLTDVQVPSPDAQSNVCSIHQIFSDGFESGDTTLWSSTSP